MLLPDWKDLEFTSRYDSKECTTFCGSHAPKPNSYIASRTL